MKKILILTFAAASLITYLIIKNCGYMMEDEGETTNNKKQRHLTGAFSKAKQYSAD